MLPFQLSENVIDRMKETSPSGSKSQRHSGVYGASGFQNFNFRIFSRKTVSDKSLLDSQVLLHFFLSVVFWVFGFLCGILEISTTVSFKTFCTKKRMN